MVPRADMRLNFILFRIYSFLCLFPSKVDIKSCSITFLSSGLKAVVHRATFAIVITYYAFSTIQLIRSIFVEGMFVAAHFPIHLLCLEYTYFAMYQAYTLLNANPERTAVLLREIYDFPEANPRTSFFQKCKERLRTWRIQDYVMVTFPSTLLQSAAGMIGIFILDPNRAQLLYSILEPHQKNSWTLIACLGVELYCQTFCHAAVGLGIVSQLSFFKTVTSKLHENWDPTRISTEKLIMKFRKLQGLVTLFNDSFRVIVFGQKQFCIYACILPASFGLVYLEKDAMIGGFCLAVALDSAASYIVLYNKAFAIPLKVEDIKESILLGRMRKYRGNLNNSDKLETDILKKTLRSVPRLAVKVGAFGRMEQSSTPDFLDFVTNQTVGLLITFRS